MKNLNTLKLSHKIERINCEQHYSPIICLNITPSEERGKRLCCCQCQTIGKTIIFPHIAEDYIQKIRSEEMLEFQNHLSLLNEVLNSARILEKTLKEMIEKISFLQGQFQDEFDKNDLQILFNKLTDNQMLGASVFQELAEIISKQQVQNGQLKYTCLINQSQIYPQIQNTISRELNNFVDKIHILKQKIENCLSKNKKLKYRSPILLDGHSTQIQAIAISCDFKFIASGTSHGQIIQWDLNSKKIKQEYLGDQNYGISDLLFTSDLQYLVAAQFEHQQPCDVLIFNLDSVHVLPSIRLKGHTRSIWRIRLTQNSQNLLSISADRTFKIWDIQQKEIIYSQQFPDTVSGLAISQNQQYISCVCENGCTVLFDSMNLTNLSLLTQWKAHDYAYGAMFTPDSEKLITCSKEIKVWSIKQLTGYYQKSPIRTFNCDTYVWSMNFALNGTTFITYDEKIRIWEFNTGTLINSLEVSGGYSNLRNKQFVLTQDMRYIITGDKNEKLKIYEKVI